MAAAWRTDINVFAERLKADLNRFYTDFDIIAVVPADREQIHSDWRLSLKASSRGGMKAFKIPEFGVSRAMVWDCEWVRILDLLHNMIKQGYDHLKEAA